LALASAFSVIPTMRLRASWMREPGSIMITPQ
jgi:hypothetical protein